MTKPSRNKLKALLVCVGLALLTLAAFSPAVDCGFVNYDDPAYVFENPPVREGLSWRAVQWSFTAMHASNWHPLTWLSHALDCTVFGLNPAGHHATNILIHTFNALLLFAVLRKLTGTFWRCAMIAALFAVHPLRVESVAWISERKDVLSVFFGLLTLFAYAKHVSEVRRQASGNAGHASRLTPHAPPSPPRSGRGQGEVSKLSPSSIFHFLSSRWYWLALGCFALSLLSKPMLVTLPCLLWLLDYWPLNRCGGFLSRSSQEKNPSPFAYPEKFTSLLVEKIPFLLLVFASIPLTLMAQAKGGSVAPIGDIPLLARLANSAIAVGWYILKGFWPSDLSVIYPLFPTRDPVQVLLGAAVTLAGVALALTQWRRRPECFTGWFWFLGTLIPVIGLVQVGMQCYADRYTYFPQIGLLIMLAWALAAWATTKFRKQMIIVVTLMALTACVVATRRQCGYWKNSETLFARAVSVTTSNYIARNNLGYSLAQRGEFDSAIAQYEAALAAAPRFVEALNNLGCAHLGKKDFRRAADIFRRALEIKPADPRTLNNLGTASHELQDYAAAISCYKRAIETEPAYAEAMVNLANSLAAAGRVVESLPHYERALELQPGIASARLNYGIELHKLKRNKEAAEQFSRLLAAGTNAAAHFWLAAIAREKSDTVTESDHLQKFLSAEPGNVLARTQLAMVLAGLGRRDEALAEASAAVAGKADFAPARYCLGLLLEQSGRVPEAIAEYEAALRIEPDYVEVLNNLAWLLASHHDASLRNGARAVKLASRACELTHNDSPMLIGTLAAAHAEAGQFQQAVAAAELAIARASTLGETNIATRNRELLELYRAGKTIP